ARVPKRSQADPVGDRERRLRVAAKGEEQDSVATAHRGDRAAGGELRLDVFAAIRDRFAPAVGLFDHATLRLKSAAIRISGNVVMPSRETILITGKIFAFRSTPPVAVSDSAAVSSARNAAVTASSSFNFASGFLPQLFS